MKAAVRVSVCFEAYSLLYFRQLLISFNLMYFIILLTCLYYYNLGRIKTINVARMFFSYSIYCNYYLHILQLFLILGFFFFASFSFFLSFFGGGGVGDSTVVFNAELCCWDLFLHGILFRNTISLPVNIHNRADTDKLINFSSVYSLNVNVAEILRKSNDSLHRQH